MLNKFRSTVYMLPSWMLERVGTSRLSASHPLLSSPLGLLLTRSSTLHVFPSKMATVTRERRNIQHSRPTKYANSNSSYNAEVAVGKYTRFPHVAFILFRNQLLSACDSNYNPITFTKAALFLAVRFHPVIFTAFYGVPTAFRIIFANS